MLVGMRVLVVEDHEVLATAVAAGLRREGMAVDLVLDGHEALGHLDRTRYDVVVLDRDLPGVHGDEVCRRITAGDSGSRVLMLTAAGTVRDKVDGLGLVADRALRPLRAITSAARAVSASSLNERLSVAGGYEEFRELRDTLNGLFARLAAAFESQRSFVANASHELRTPLAAERTVLQVALADPAASAESLRAACEQVLQLGEQQERLVDALLTLAAGQGGLRNREPFDLAEVTSLVMASRPPRRRPPGRARGRGPAPRPRHRGPGPGDEPGRQPGGQRRAAQPARRARPGHHRDPRRAPPVFRVE